MTPHVHDPMEYLPFIPEEVTELGRLGVFVSRPRFYRCFLCVEPMYGVPA